jgi:shikimate dehydrogenase
VDLYAVVGNPVSHSKSPRIHNLFAQQTGEQMEYIAIQAPLDAFETEVQSFFETGGKGLNITVPFKERAWARVDVRKPRAERAGAVNTLYVLNGNLMGDNTDGLGLVQDLLSNHGCILRDQRILVIGAGGAVRGVLEPLLEHHPAELVIANRTPAKAEQLVELFQSLGPVTASAFAALDEPFDLIINGTSASLAGDLPPLPPHVIASHTKVYDMMYGAQETVFNRWAREQGAALVMDGLGMLVEQAAEAFLIWRGVRPDTAPVLERLRRND